MISLTEIHRTKSLNYIKLYCEDNVGFLYKKYNTGYQTAYSQLAFAGSKEHDPLESIPDAKLYLAKQLGKLSAAHPGKVKIVTMDS